MTSSSTATDAAEEVGGSKRDPVPLGAIQQRVLVTARHEPAGPTPLFGISPALDGAAVQAEPARDRVNAAALLDDFGSGFHDVGVRQSHSSVNAVFAQTKRNSRWRDVPPPTDSRRMDTDDLKRELAKPGRSQAALARFLGFGNDASPVNKMVNGKRQIKASELSKITAYLQATAMGGDESRGEDDLDRPKAMTVEAAPTVLVPEYDVRLSAGPGFYVDHETIRRAWPLPRFLVVDHLGLNPGRITMQEVIGDSMEPTLSSGDYVLIDLADTRTGLPGVFAIWDGDALVCKRLERVPGEEPETLRLRSDNPLHGEYRVLAERVNVVGRVRWVTRRM